MKDVCANKIDGRSLRRTRFTVPCAECGKPVTRTPGNFSKGKSGPLAGMVFCDRECQKRKFRGRVKCAWPGCGVERLVEAGNFRSKSSQAYMCDWHTERLHLAVDRAKFTKHRADWLNDAPMGHRHLTSKFYRWSVFFAHGEKCAKCECPMVFGPQVHIDHKVPVWEGGETRFSNMQPLCVPCHKDKTSKEQVRVNGRRWGRGDNTRRMTHHEKDEVIAALRAQLLALGLEPKS